MFKLEKQEINRNPFIGLYLAANNDLLLYPATLPQKNLDVLTNALQVKSAVQVMINSSPLVGLYAVLNSNGIVLPDFISDNELATIKKIGLNTCILSSNFAAIRNNLLVNDKVAVVNPNLTNDEIKRVGDCLGVEVVRKSISGIPTIGSLNVANNNGILAYNNTSMKEATELAELFKAKLVRSTTNLGSVANAYSVVANDKGAVVGSLSSGFETANVFEALSND